MFGISLHDVKLRWLPVHLPTLKHQSIDTGFFQPVLSPLAQVTLHPIHSHRFVHAVNQVLTLRILVRKQLDAVFKSLLHDLPTNEIIHSLDPARSLLVRNGIKSRCRVTCVLDGNLNRMRGWTLVRVERGIQEVEEVALCVWIT